MATLTQLRQGLEHVWDTVVEGWRTLTSRASGAITRFRSSPRDGEGETGLPMAAEAVTGIGWGVLAAEVWEDDGHLFVRVEAPGMKRSDFDLQVVDGYLLIRGEKRLERERRQGTCHVLECAYGSFERAIPLPAEVDADKARAKYRRGVLLVDLPLRRSGKRRLTIS